MKKSSRTEVRPHVPTFIGLVFLLGGLFMTAVQAEEDVTEVEDTVFNEGIGGNNQDPTVLLQEIEQKRIERSSVLGDSPIKSLHDGADA